MHLQLHLLKLQRGRYLLPGRKQHMVPVEGHHMTAHLCCRLQMFHLQTQPVHTNMCYYKLFRLLIPHKHCYYKLFHLLIPRKHVLLQGVSPVDSTQTCAITGCFCLTLIIFLGMPVIYFWLHNQHASHISKGIAMLTIDQELQVFLLTSDS